MENQFVKVYKTKAYYKRYQTKFRRRREGKTDYYQRRRLVAQNKTKYNSPKYRLVVRITNADVICQIVYSKIIGDVVVAAAYSHELPRYGVKVGLTNYSAVYCTGLLLARRVLQKLGMDSLYQGATTVDGNYFIVDDLENRRAFQAYLDIGLARTTSGARIFAAVKGACDGGLYVPHSARRFPGYNQDKDEYDPKAHRARIFGGHVANYMKYLQEEDESKYKKQFSKFIAAGVTADNLEQVYQKAHAAIRADPVHKSTAKPAPAVQKSFHKKKQSLKQRKYRVELKKQKLLRQIANHQDN